MNKLKKIFLAFSDKERKIFLIAAVLVIVSGLVLIIAAVRGATKAMPTRGGEYIEGFLGQPAAVNPVSATSDVDKSLTRLVFAKLEDLASQIELDKSGLFWKVRLKEDLVWTDGKPLTSDDVVFTIQKIQDESAQSPLISKWRGVGAERISELEVQLRTPGQAPILEIQRAKARGESLNFSTGQASALEYEIKNLYLLPKHIFNDVPPINWRLSDYNLSPVGSGFYRFKNYDKDRRGFITRYELEINPDYPGETALIENISFKFYQDKESLVAAFNRGMISGAGGLDPQEVGNINRPFEKLSFPSPNYYAVFINQSKNTILKDIAVRKALSLSTPREALVKEVLGGDGQIASGPVVQGVGSDSLAAQDKDGAIQALESAGWRIYSPSDGVGVGVDNSLPGVRQKTINKTKVNLEINLTAPEIPFLTATADKLKAEWEGIGFKVNVSKAPEGEALDNMIKNRDYEMLLYGNFLGDDLDLTSFWRSTERFYPGLNLSLYSNKAVDVLLDKLGQNPTQQDRESTLEQIQSLIAQDYPAIFLYSPNYVLVAENDLKGIQGKLVTDPADRFKESYKWNLKTVRVLK